MSQELEDELVSALIDIMSDGFNRSMSALEEVGAINTKKLRTKYTGTGSEYYDLVTDALELTADYARPRIRKIIKESLRN